jgi:hypothetical protein
MKTAKMGQKLNIRTEIVTEIVSENAGQKIDIHAENVSGNMGILYGGDLYISI